MKEMIKSDTTGRVYDPSKCIRLLNIKQLIFYMKNGIEILDFYPSKDLKTQQDVLVYVVDRETSQEVYKKWMATRYAQKKI